MIYHIYWGTAGNAGLYMDEIYQTLQKAGFEQKCFVSYYYPFDYGEKVFFKRTEMEHCHYKGALRRAMQAFELLIALIRILLAARKEKPQVINYSYVSTGNKVIYWFIKKVKKESRCRLVITCHDVVPFAKDADAYDKELIIKRKIYALADFFLIHNNNSRNDLLRIFKVNPDQVLEHPFPLMDLSKLNIESEGIEERYDFLFIGHLRREKGIEFLMEAWPLFHRLHPSARLCVAGNPAYYRDFIESKRSECENNGIELIMGFVSDIEYIRLVRSAKFVLFPYLSGTNSGVISTVISLNKGVITSDIEMFINNPLVPKDMMFKVGDIQSFIDILETMYNRDIVVDNKELIYDYRKVFSEQIYRVYSFITK